MDTQLSLEEIHQIELDMIVGIVKFCEENNLKVFLDSGTLLGAIRHGDFIPWDDDADLVMPREDYNRFKEIFVGTKYYSLANSNYPNLFLKVYDKRTRLIETGLRHPQDIGIYVDIFPIDVLTESIPQQKRYFNVMNRYTRLIRIKETRYRRTGSGIREQFKQLVFKAATFIPERLLFSRADRYAQRFAGEISSLCTQMVMSFKKEKILQKAWFEESKIISFRGHDLPVPSDYKAYLTALYGADFMTPPPADKIETHTYNASWR